MPAPALRVAFLAQENVAVPPPRPGGSVARVVYELARRLVDHELDVTVCSLPHPDIAEGMHEGVRYLRVEDGLDRRRHAVYRQLLRVPRRLDLPHRELQGFPLYAHSYALSGLRRLAEHDPDIVHLQNVSQFVPLARRLLPRARVVLHMHCDWLRELPPRTARSRLDQTDLVLGVSDYISGRIRNGFPELASRVRTLHNGVRTGMFAEGARDRSDLRRREGIGAGPLILYVGTIAPEKGVDVLVRAFAEVRRTLPGATLAIVGAPARYFQVRAPSRRAARAELRRRQRGYVDEVARLGESLGDSVVFAGARPHGELPDWYAAADVLAMPSTGQEPFPLPVLEALAGGVPVVATSRGGLPEIVLDGVDGRVVGPDDPSALAEALVELCTDPSLRQDLGLRGKELVARRFTWAYQAERLASYYRELDSKPASTLRAAACRT